MRKEEIKAAVMYEFGKIETRTYPYPKVPKDAMLVKMLMSGVCGTDGHIFDGCAPEIPLPIILGHENVAEVYEIGDKARKNMEVHGEVLSEGDRIAFWPGIVCGKCWYCRCLSNYRQPLCSNMRAYGLDISCEKPPHLFGGFAEYVYIMPGTWVFKLPTDLPNEVAVLVDVLASSGGIKRAMMPLPAAKEGFGPGDVVAIQGSGPIGLVAGIHAKLCGASKIILLGAPKHRLKFAEKLEVFDHIINIEEITNIKERVKMVKDLTPGKVGPDLVVECTGTAAAIPEGLEMLRRGGVYVEISAFYDLGDVVINPCRHFCWKDVVLIGQYGNTPHIYDYSIKLLEMAWKRGWPLNELVTHRFPIEEAQKAIETHKRLECIKAVITPK